LSGMLRSDGVLVGLIGEDGRDGTSSRPGRSEAEAREAREARSASQQNQKKPPKLARGLTLNSDLGLLWSHRRTKRRVGLVRRRRTHPLCSSDELWWRRVGHGCAERVCGVVCVCVVVRHKDGLSISQLGIYNPETLKKNEGRKTWECLVVWEEVGDPN
jgi:hypothetical protein